MSRSTDPSKGTPDDDEGRLSDDTGSSADSAAADAPEERADGVAAAEDADDTAAEDVDVADDDADAQPSETADELHEGSVEDADAVDRQPAAAASVGRPTSKRGSGSGRPATVPAKRPADRSTTRSKQEERRGPIAAIVLFVRQVISELRKVVTPTGKELGTYVAVVIVFVLIVMAYVGVIDLAVGKLVLWAFGG